MALSPKAARLLKWMRHLQVREIDIAELQKLTGLSKTAIRNSLHELETNGDITVWMED